MKARFTHSSWRSLKSRSAAVAVGVLLTLCASIPLGTRAQQVITVGTGTTTTYQVPVNNFYNNSYSQILYMANELQPGTISTIGFEYSYSSASTYKTNVRIYMGTTNTSTFSSVSDYITSGLTLVYSGSLNCSQGWNTFNLQTPYNYSGNGNLLVVIADNSGNYNSSSYTFYATSVSNKVIHYYSDSYAPSGYSPNTSMSSTLPTVRPNTRFTITPACPSITYPVDGSTVNASAITATWGAMSGATGYHIYVSNSPQRPAQYTYSTTSTSQVVSGLPYGTNYLWVIPYTGSTESSSCNSNYVEFTRACPSTVAAPTITADADLNHLTCGQTVTLTAHGEYTNYCWYSDAGCTNLLGTGVNYSFSAGDQPITVYCQSACVGAPGGEQVNNFSYTGGQQTFTVPAGITSITLEVWGAQGGYRSSTTYGGKGGYSTGTAAVTPGQTLYVNVGGSGNTGGTSGGYNGGGSRTTYNGGGGATHIATRSGVLSSLSSYQSNVLIVAGGGGSDGASSKTGMYGGGTSGGTATQSYGSGGGGGTQTAGGAGGSGNAGTFGQGGAGLYYSSGYGGAGGGGWYGGGGAYPDGSGDDDRGGGGGSGYIGGVTGGQTIAGNLTMPNPTGGTMTGREGNGYARITYQIPPEITYSSATSITAGGAPAPGAPTIEVANACPGEDVTLTVVNPIQGLTYGWWDNPSCSGDPLYEGTIYTIPSMQNSTTFYVRAYSGTMNPVYDFSYTGSAQSLTVPGGVRSVTLEVWGAQGGGQQTNGNTSAGYGGNGGYSAGTMSVSGGEILYVYVGGEGQESSALAYGGFNGGGTNYGSGSGEPACGGGGATDIRLNGNTLYDRIIVAGGGGGGGEDSGDQGGYGGGTSGGAGNAYSYQGTQTSAGTGAVFGIGASAGNDGGGGGGGWYGGGTYGGSQTIPSSGSGSDCNGGSGGSGYVWTSATSSYAPSGYRVPTSYYLSNAQTIAGNVSFPAPNGGNETGHAGNGYARITFNDANPLCQSPICTVPVNLYQAPSFTLSASALSSCNQSPVTLTINNPSSDIIRYEWSDGYTGGGLSRVVVPGLTTTYTVTAFNSGCGTSHGVEIVVNAPLVDITGTDNGLCVAPGTEVTLSIGGGSCPESVNQSNGTTILYPGCEVYFYDDGGPNGSYTNSQSLTHTFTSSDGSPISIVFQSMSAESCCDYIYVRDGTSSSYTQLYGDYMYTMTTNTTYTANSGNLTIYSTSDGSGVSSGWVALITCGAPMEYEWNNGASEQTITVTPHETTTYTVTVSGNSFDCDAFLEYTVRVLPVLEVTLENPMVCAGAMVELTAATADNYAWHRNTVNGAIVSNSATYTAPAGTYVVVATNDDGCSVNATVTVDELDVPSPGELSDQDVCQSDYEITLHSTANAVGGGNVEYQWTIGSVSTGWSTDPEYTLTPAQREILGTGSFTMTRYFRDDCGSQGHVSATLNINPPMALPVVEGVRSVFCGQPTTLTASSSVEGNIVYRWYSDPQGENLVYEGNEFVTPDLTENTTYYLQTLDIPVTSIPTDFSYTGGQQTYVVPNGVHQVQLEVWGAEGGQGGPDNMGGAGGYSTGSLEVQAGDILYVYVGGQGVGSSGTDLSGTCEGGYNGGGRGYSGSNGVRGGGGGATHIATASGLLQNLSSNQSAVKIVAGGGGGNMYFGGTSYVAGTGGGLSGTNGSNSSYGYGGTQTAGGQGYSSFVAPGFGFGGYYDTNSSSGTVCGGGGGWYGGGSGNPGGGGSGYIAGVSNGATYTGLQSFPSPTGTTELGHTGNGHARITITSMDIVSGDNCPSEMLPVTITVQQMPAPVVEVRSACIGEASELVVVNPQEGYSYQWSTTPDFNQIEFTGTTYTPSVAGTTTYYVRSVAGSATESVDFDYTGSEQVFTVPAGVHNLQLEVWGAQGGEGNDYSGYGDPRNGGNGGYSVGTLNVSPGTVLHVYVGQEGLHNAGSNTAWNGGGAQGVSSYEAGTGGGATDIRIDGTTLYHRVIVAGGGGGGGNNSIGGEGGGLSGIQPLSSTQFESRTAGTGGGQTSGYQFGVGQGLNGENLNGGGGGGWYGGGQGANSTGGGGGSGYVYTASTASNYPAGCMLNSSHYLTDAQTLAGNQSFLAPDGTTETGHTGNGYARITMLGMATNVCPSAVSTVTFTPVAAPTFTVTASSNSYCANEPPVTFTIENPSPDITEYLWSDGTTTTETSYTVTPGYTTSYTVTVTNGTCQVESQPITILVNAPEVTVTGTDNGLCVAPGDEVTITVGGGSQSGDIIIGTQESTGYNYLPSNSCYNYSASEQIYTAEEIGGPGLITDIAFYLATYAQQRTGITVYMRNTNKESFSGTSDFVQMTASDVVAENVTLPNNSTSGWYNIHLDTPFEYDGHSNLLLGFNTPYTSYSCSNYFYTYNTGSNRSIAFWNDSYGNPLTELPYEANTVSTYCDYIRFSIVAVGDVVWSNGSTETSITVTPNETTTYTVTVTDNSHDCPAILDYTVRVNPTITITSVPEALCNAGEEATLTAEGGVSYFWNTGAMTPSITVNPDQPTSYSVVVTSEDGCTNTESYYLDIPVFNAGSIGNTGTNICQSSTESVIINSVQNGVAGGMAEYRWYCDGQLLPNSNMASYEVTPAELQQHSIGTHTYTREYLDGCSNVWYASDGQFELDVVGPLPQPSVVGQTSVVCGSDATLSIANPNPELTYYWYADESCTEFIGTGTTIDLSVLTVDTTVYVVASTTPDAPSTVDFMYTGSEQVFVVPNSCYQVTLEVWGAQGGYRSSSTNGGRGGYSVGTLAVSPGDVLYVNVGGSGNGGVSVATQVYAGGYNGGGYRYGYHGGGGATHIATASGLLKDLYYNQSSVLIVAGGGGSDGGASYPGSYGGGLIGGTATGGCSSYYDYCSIGGNQTYSGYSSNYTTTTQATNNLDGVTTESLMYGGFGFGGAGVYYASGYGGAGGGGWYGGTGNIPDGSVDDDTGGGGGSGYVSTSLTDAMTYAGNLSIPDPTTPGATTMGREGDGYARITSVYSASAGTCPSIPLPIEIEVTAPAAPLVQDASTVCGAPVTLEVADANENLTYYWSTHSDFSDTIHTGSTFTAFVDNTTEFYVRSAVSNPVQGANDFEYTGGPQTFTIPSGISEVTVEVWGAEGGAGANGLYEGAEGGRGAYGVATIPVSAGDEFTVYVGQAGNDGLPLMNGADCTGGNGGYGAGGAGGGGWCNTSSNAGGGGGGGGFTMVKLNGDIVLIAAGGGGGGGGSNSSGSSHGAGGAGGAGGAAYGVNGSPSSGSGSYGYGASQSAGGSAGTSGTAGGYLYGGGATGYSAGTSGNGSTYAGGSGGAGGSSSSAGGSGGGGGGYYGGGGGGQYASGGGGGSSYLRSGLSGSLVAGNASITEPNGNSSMGHAGNGFARISVPQLPEVGCVSPVGSATVTVEAADELVVEDVYIHCGQNATLEISDPIEGLYYEWYADAACTQFVAQGTSVSFENMLSDTTLYVKRFGLRPAGNGTGVVSYTFNYTGSAQTFVVPITASEVTIEAYGAQGGDAVYDSYTWYGGYGGYAVGDLQVTPGETLYVYVGGKGTNGTNGASSVAVAGGWNGGGNGGYGTNYFSAGGGGGASDVRRGGTELTDRVIVAGGGGGAGYGATSLTISGGAGGGLEGGLGTYLSSYESRMGRAATQSAGGAGGTAGTSYTGYAGTFGQGGAGHYGNAGGAGGGGGWYGGGGGADGAQCSGSGGGGSGYTTGLTNASMQTGVQEGNGRVVINVHQSRFDTLCATEAVPVSVLVQPLAAPAVSSVTTMCGNEVTLTVVDPDPEYEYRWYSDAACTQQIATGTYYVVDQAVSDTTFYVKSFFNHQVYTINDTTNFVYTGAAQTYTIPANTASLQLQVWGAQGGGQEQSGNTAQGYSGRGGYSVGTMPVANGNEVLTVYVGGVGGYSDPNGAGIAVGGWNGGGTNYGSSSGEPAGGGGGATDIRLNGTTLYHRIIVAGGGGGGGEDSGDTYGVGGGESGTAGGSRSDAGTQTAGTNGAVFGYGASSPNDGGAGGGGWYGGGTNGGSQTIPSSSTGTDCQGGSGGSGYVWTSATSQYAPTGYSVPATYYLTNAQTIAGNTSFPAPGGGVETGHPNSGYARIIAHVQADYWVCESEVSPVSITIEPIDAPWYAELYNALDENNGICDGSEAELVGYVDPYVDGGGNEVFPVIAWYDEDHQFIGFSENEQVFTQIPESSTTYYAYAVSALLVATGPGNVTAEVTSDQNVVATGRGIFFDVVANQEMTIDSLSFVPGSTTDETPVYISYRNTTCQGHTTSNTGWTSCYNAMPNMTAGQLCKVALPTPVHLNAGDTYSFYISSSAQIRSRNYVTGTEAHVGGVTASNRYIRILNAYAASNTVSVGANVLPTSDGQLAEMSFMGTVYYNLLGDVTFGCMSADSVEVEVELYELPEAVQRIEVVNPNEDYICADAELGLKPIGAYMGYDGYFRWTTDGCGDEGDDVESYYDGEYEYNMLTITPEEDATYYVQIVSEACGATECVSVEITVNHAPQIARLATPGQLCAGSGLGINAPEVVCDHEIESQEWQYSTNGVDFQTFTNVNNLTEAYDNCYVRYAVSTSCFPENYSDTIQIRVDALPEIGALADFASICENTVLDWDSYLPTVNLHNNSGAVTEQGWIVKNGNQVLTYSPDMVFTYGQDITIQYYAENACGTTTTDVKTLEVKAYPIVGQLSPIADAVCAGQPLPVQTPEVTDRGGNIITFWEYATAAGATRYTPFDVEQPITYDMNGKFIRFVAKNECDSTVSNAIQIIINDVAQVGNIDPMEGTICSRTTFEMAAPQILDNGGTQIDSLVWFINAAEDLNNDNFLDTVHIGDEIIADTWNGKWLRYGVHNGCGWSYSNAIQIFVYPDHHLTITPGDTAVCFGPNYTLSASSDLNATFAWTSTQGGNLVGDLAASQVVAERPEIGYQTYTVTATDEATGCSATASSVFNVFAVGSDTTVHICASELNYVFDPVEKPNEVCTQSGTYFFSYVNESGCDSVVTLHLNVTYPVERYTRLHNCNNTPAYVWAVNNRSYGGMGVEDTIIRDTVIVPSTTMFSDIDQHACDSIIYYLELEISNDPYLEIPVTHVTVPVDQEATAYFNVRKDCYFSGGKMAIAYQLFKDDEPIGLFDTTGVASIYTYVPMFESSFGRRLDIGGGEVPGTTLSMFNYDYNYFYVNFFSQLDNYITATWHTPGEYKLQLVAFRKATDSGQDHFYLDLNNEVMGGTNAWSTDSIFSDTSYIYFHVGTVDTLQEETITLCENDLPYYYSGTSTPITAAGYYELFVGNEGEYQLQPLNVLVNPSNETHLELELNSCQRYYVFGDQNISYPGEYTQQLQNVNGCDSIVILTVTATDEPTTLVEHITACDQYTWNNQILTETAVYEYSDGTEECPFLHILDLTINHSVELDETVAVSSLQFPYEYDRNNIFSDYGDYDVVYSTETGCDSIIHLHIVAANADIVVTPTETSTEMGDNNSYDINIEAGSVDNMKVGIDYEIRRNGELVDNVANYGRVYFSTDVARMNNSFGRVLTNAEGSIPANTFRVIYYQYDYFYMNFLSSTTNHLNVTWNEPGEYEIIFNLRQREGGSDFPQYFLNENDLIGGAGSIAVGGVIASDTLRFHYDAEPVETSLDTTICSNELPFIYRGEEYNENTTTDLHFTDAYNVYDTTVHFTLTINTAYDLAYDAEVCEGADYSDDNFTLTADEIAVAMEEQEVEADDPVEFVLNGTTELGCDSIVTLSLYVRPNPVLNVTTATPVVCEGSDVSISVSGADSYMWENESESSTLAVEGIEVTTTFRVTGFNDYDEITCQSMDSVTVTVIPGTYTIQLYDTICLGEEFVNTTEYEFDFSQDELEEAGTYTNTVLIGSSDCGDYFAAMNLTVMPVYNEEYGYVEVDGEVCQGYGYSDQMTQFYLTAQEIAEAILNADVEDNDTYVDVDFYNEGETEYGCDSITHLTLRVNLSPRGYETLHICADQLPSYSEYGITGDTTIENIIRGVGSNGCDSVAVVTYIFDPVFDFEVSGNVDVCANTALDLSVVSQVVLDSVRWFNEDDELIGTQNSFTESEEIPSAITVVGYLGACSYTFESEINVLPLNEVVIDTTICSGDVYVAPNGETYQTSVENATWTATSNDGCDTVYTLTVTVQERHTRTIDVSRTIEELPYIYNGYWCETAGRHEVYVTDPTQDCDSLIVINLTVIDNHEGEDFFVATQVDDATYTLQAFANATDLNTQVSINYTLYKDNQLVENVEDECGGLLNISTEYNGMYIGNDLNTATGNIPFNTFSLSNNILDYFYFHFLNRRENVVTHNFTTPGTYTVVFELMPESNGTDYMFQYLENGEYRRVGGRYSVEGATSLAMTSITFEVAGSGDETSDEGNFPSNYPTLALSENNISTASSAVTLTCDPNEYDLNSQVAIKYTIYQDDEPVNMLSTVGTVNISTFVPSQNRYFGSNVRTGSGSIPMNTFTILPNLTYNYFYLNFLANSNNQIEASWSQAGEYKIAFDLVEMTNGSDLAVQWSAGNRIGGRSAQETGLLLATDTLRYQIAGQGAAPMAISDENGENAFGMSLYPNPASNHTVLTLDKVESTAMVTITDINGKLMMSYDASSIVNGKLDINVAEWADGIYFVNVRSNEQVQSKKLVIVR